jgi:poly-beta-1,6-N-acetyl-D-glucosamine synthase
MHICGDARGRHAGRRLVSGKSWLENLRYLVAEGKKPMHQLTYVLITPARNEEAHIEEVIRSVMGQSTLPVRWVIVDDGSEDRTAAIVGKYLPMCEWLELVQLPVRRDRSFAGKVFAFNAGLDRVTNLDYDVIGNLDADVSFDADYCEFLLSRFAEDPSLGVAGTIFKEDGYNSATDSFEGHSHVAGGCQLFRHRCFEDIGGYIAHRAGGIDWIAVTTARMMGWRTRSFREKAFFHHRSLGTAERGLLAAAFSYGEKDYYLGGHPVWQLCRVSYRMIKKPFLLGGLALAAGYLSAFLHRMERPVSDELMAFHRKEQMLKLKAIFKSIIRFRRVDSFAVTSN